MKSQDIAVMTAVNASIQRATREEPASPWVINLRAAMTSLRRDIAPLVGHEELRVYEIARLEEGRPRHRLRAGYFANRAAAEAILPAVRLTYPAAFATPAMREDLLQVGDFDLAALAEPAPVELDADESADLADAIVLELLEDASSRKGEAEANVSIGSRDVAALSLACTPATVESADESKVPTAAMEAEPEWFALELVRTPVRPAPDSLAALDIFSAYELYVIKTRNEQGELYSVRLGFFRERISASQVASYIRGAYPNVEIAPVSSDEQKKRVKIRTEAEEDVGIDTVVLHAPDTNVIELARGQDPASDGVFERPARQWNERHLRIRQAQDAWSTAGRGSAPGGPLRNGDSPDAASQAESVQPPRRSAQALIPARAR
jgi:hypothetical protein